MKRTNPWAWWCLAAASVLGLYISAPYVTEIQTLLRRTFQDYFEPIFRTTIALLGLTLLVSGIWVELKRARSNGPQSPGDPHSLLRLVLKKLALAAVCVVLYYVGLTYVLGTSPSEGVRIIEFIHLFEYSLVTGLVLKAVSTSTNGHSVYIVGSLIMLLVGLGDEAVQGYLARRVGEFRDVFTNVVVAELAMVSVALIFSPRTFTGRIGRRQIGPILLLAGVAVLATAVFIDVVHIGYRIEDDRCGVFYSLYPEAELLHRSREVPIGPRLPVGSSIESARIRGYWAHEDFYATEARKHKAERDIFLPKKMYWQAFCEEQIRRLYYRPYANRGEWGAWTFDRMRDEFGDYDVASFTSYHHDLVFRDWKRWHVWSVAFCACVILLVVGIVFGGTRGPNAHS